MNNYSSWQKADLHLHTPKSFLNNNFSCSSEEYVKKIIDSGLNIVAITNYFKFDDEDFNIAEMLRKEGITVFLNLELRLAYQNKEDNFCDYHIIFSDEVKKTDINTFLMNLVVEVGGTKKKANALITKQEFSSAVIEYEQLKDTLKDVSLNLEGKYITGFLSRGHGNGRTSTVYEKLATETDFLIHSSDSEINLEEDRIFWLSHNKPLVQSSDAHNLDLIGCKYSWIKIDKDFGLNALNQIKYEPDLRLNLQKENPLLKKKHWYIEKILILNSKISILPDQEIIFSPYLNGVIGGRATGKSTLLKILSLFGGYSSGDPMITFLKSFDDEIDITIHAVNRDGEKKEFTISSFLYENESIPLYYLSQRDIESFSDDKNKKTFQNEFLEIIGINSNYYFEEEQDEINDLIDELEEIDLFELKILETIKNVSIKRKIILKKKSIIDRLAEIISYLKKEKKKLQLKKQKKRLIFYLTYQQVQVW